MGNINTTSCLGKIEVSLDWVTKILLVVSVSFRAAWAGDQWDTSSLGSTQNYLDWVAKILLFVWVIIRAAWTSGAARLLVA